MAITELFTDLNIIAALDNEPNDVSGLTAAQLKAKFDEGPNGIKAYLNGTHIPELDAEHLPYLYGSAGTIKEVMEDLTAGVMPDESVTTAKMADSNVTLAKMASDVYASQAEAEAGSENTKFMTALRVAQAIAEQRLKAATGTITGVTTTIAQTATLPAAPLFVIAKCTASSALYSHAETVLLLNGNTQDLFYSTCSPSVQCTAKLSGTALTITAADTVDPSALVFNYVSFYI